MGGGFLVEPHFRRPAGRDLLYHSHPHLFVGREILSALRIVKPQTVVLVEPRIGRRPMVGRRCTDSIRANRLGSRFTQAEDAP